MVWSWGREDLGWMSGGSSLLWERWGAGTAAQRGCGCPVHPWRCSRPGWMGPWALSLWGVPNANLSRRWSDREGSPASWCDTGGCPQLWGGTPLGWHRFVGSFGLWHCGDDIGVSPASGCHTLGRPQLWGCDTLTRCPHFPWEVLELLTVSPTPIVGAYRSFQGPTGSTWGLPGHPKTNLGCLQTLLGEFRKLSRTSPADPSAWFQEGITTGVIIADLPDKASLCTSSGSSNRLIGPLPTSSTRLVFSRQRLSWLGHPCNS